MLHLPDRYVLPYPLLPSHLPINLYAQAKSKSQQVLSGSTFAYSPTYFFTQAGIAASSAYKLNLGGTACAFVGYNPLLVPPCSPGPPHPLPLRRNHPLPSASPNWHPLRFDQQLRRLMGPSGAVHHVALHIQSHGRPDRVLYHI